MQVDLLKGNVGAKFREEMRSAQTEAETGGKGISGALSGALGMAAVAASAIGLAMVGAGVASLKSAADFQESMTQLVTGAGESSDNIKLVSQGILDMAGQVGVSAQDLAAGMYMVESAGFHGAQGLSVLRAAAEGAKVGNADMATVANAVTSALNAYGLSGDHAVSVTNALVATVAAGKMHMQDLAGSIGTILPEAASLKIGIGDVGGAIATMTMQGTDAFTATQGIRFLLTSLVKPASAAAKEMENFGLKSTDVAARLASGDFQGTLQMITDAIGKKFPEGSAEYLQALATMVGGTRGLNTVLELTGSHMSTWQSNIASVSAGAKQGGKDVHGWAEVQKDFNFQTQAASDGAGAFGISIGQRLLPYVTQLLAMFVASLPSLEGFANQAVTVGIQVGTAMVPWIQRAGQVLGFLVQHGDEVKAALIGLGAAMAAFKIISFVQGWLAVISAMRSAAATEGIMTAVNWLLGTSELFAMWPLLLIVVAIGAVIAIGYLLITHWKQVSALAIHVGTVVRDFLGHAFSELGTVVHGFVNAAGARIGGFFSWLGSGAHAVVAMVGGAFSALGSAVHGALTRLTTTAENAWREFARRPMYWVGFLVAYVPNKLASLAIAFNVWIVGMIVKGLLWAARMVDLGEQMAGKLAIAVITKVYQLYNDFLGWVADMLDAALQWGVQMQTKAEDAAANFLLAIGEEWNRLPGQAWNWLTTVFPKIVEFGANLYTKAQDAAAQLLLALGEKWNDLENQMFNVGVSIVQGVINGIKSMISSGVGAIGDFVNGLVQGAKTAAGNPHSPAPVTIPLGEALIQGVMAGVDNYARPAQVQVAHVISSLVPPTPPVVTASAAIGTDAATETTQRELYDTLVRIRDSMHMVELYLQRLSAGRTDLAWSMKLQ